MCFLAGGGGIRRVFRRSVQSERGVKKQTGYLAK